MGAKPRQRDAGLDGMRGLAALLVFGVHMWIYQLPNTLALRRDNFAETLLFETRVSFVMFFVLSGYLLYRPFARAALRVSPPVSIRSYLVRRAARILPAYYLAIGGTLILLATARGAEGRRMIEASEFPLFLVFAQNYNPETLLRLNAATWTLVVEVAFYLLLPLIALVALHRVSASFKAQCALLLSLVAAGFVWNAIDLWAGWGPVASHSPPSFLPYFACGMLVALAVERLRESDAPVGRGATLALVGGAVIVLVANGYWHGSDRDPDGFMIETFADIGAAIAFAALIAAMTIGTGTGVHWLGRRPLAWMGEISYGMYLWHIPLIVWARGHGLLDGGPVLDIALVLPVAIGLGAASWYFVELPLMRRAARKPRLSADEQADEERRQRSQARTIALANPKP